MAGRTVTVACAALACAGLLAAARAADASRGPGHGLDHYAMADFDRVEKIDVHVHLHGELPGFLARARADNVRLLTINVDYADFPPIDEQQRTAIALRRANPGRVEFAATFPVDGFEAPGWPAATLRRLDAAFADGAIAVKVWKNVGMSLRDSSGRAVMVDDARLAPVFAALADRGVVVLGHQGEPLNCWLAPERMTVRGDREYFAAHPQYYMADHPEWPSHARQIAARDRLLVAHPTLKFVGLHLASLEWDVDRLAAFLDRFPQASVDVAARLVHLEQQAIRHRAKVRRFLIRYQDRILYGSDIARLPDATDAAFAAEADAAWRADWRFLNTGDTLRSDDLPAAFRGLALPRAVVDKIYRSNARRVFPAAWPSSAAARIAPRDARIALALPPEPGR
jgi:predicted TIM-barrel fold metal-dependent hydrolase